MAGPIDTHRLRLFVAVAEHLHFGRAARALGMAQPPLSQQIRQLEERLGGSLFERSSRRVSLTPLGAALAPDARAVLDQLAAMARRAEALVTGREGELRLGYVGPALDELVAPALGRFREALPGIEVTLTRVATADQLDAVRQGQLNLGVARLFGHDVTGLETELLWREPYRLAAPAADVLAKRKSTTLRAVHDRVLLAFRRAGQPALYDRLLGDIARTGARPRRVVELDTKQEIVALARAGLGVGLVPASSARRAAPGVAFLQLRGDLPRVELSAVRAPGTPAPPLGAFLDCLRAHVASVRAACSP